MTDNIGIVIQCRDGSTRHKEKSVRPFYGEKSILEILIERFRHLPNKTVVATEPKSLKTIEICKKTKTTYYIGSEENVLKRLFDTAFQFNFDGIFRICADNPLLQLPLIYPVKVWAETNDYDYVSWNSAMRRHEGFFGEYISSRALDYTYRFVDTMYECEHVTPHIINHPERYKHKILPIPDIMDLIPIRLTVDTESDFIIARKVYKYIGEKHWSYIYDYVQHHPTILETMKKNIERNPK